MLLQKKRVYEIAQKLKITSQKLIEELAKLNIKVTSHMNTLTEEETKMILDLFGNEDLKDDKKSYIKTTKTENKKVRESNKNKEKKENKDKKKDIEKKHNNDVLENNKVKEDKTSEKAQEAITIGASVKVGDFADILNINVSDLIKKLMGLGVMANINQNIDFETAELVAMDYGIEVVSDNSNEKIDENTNEIFIEEDKEEELLPRPPIVTVMGHVDHGKTSLLDSIRNTKVTSSEAGGITQHIGAYEVNINGKKIVFLDTPGHEAFTQMRARGAMVTDIAILVVASDDGIKPQTIEAISHAKAANVPIIVAINKIDKPSANVERVKQELSEQGLLVEDWGGETIAVPVSAKTGENIDSLLEMILLVAEMEELKANPNRKAYGTVVESNLDKSKGVVASLIVTNGTLNIGDAIIAGSSYGKIRAMVNDRGKRVKKAGPSTPVEILGLNEIPNAGDQFVVMDSEKEAREIGENRKAKLRDEQMKAKSKINLDDLFDRMQSGDLRELNIVLKTDVQGSSEAISQSLQKLNSDEVKVNIIHTGVGAISESDVILASASNAIIIGFNVRPTVGAKSMVENEKVDMRTYSVIYEILEDIEKAMKGLLDPEFREVTLGNAEVRELFKYSGVGTIAGTMVINGKIKRNSKARLIRNGIVIYDGDIATLRRFKDDVKEVSQGYECGITLENFNDIKKDDIIESYQMEEIDRG